MIEIHHYHAKIIPKQSRHSIDGSELSHPPSLKEEASNEPEQGITDEQLSESRKL